MISNKKKKYQKYDKCWKDIIEDLVEDFLAFFFPDLYPQIDFTRGIDFLEQEYNKLFPDNESEDRKLDKLIKLFLKDGSEQWILIHIEIQGYKDENYSERMFIYFYQIFDKFNKKIIALSIFTDDIKKFHPKSFDYDYHETSLHYKYRTYKIMDQNEEELKKSDNPFAMAILAGYYLIKAKKDLTRKYDFKIRLTRLLFEKGYDKQKIANLLIFIDAVISLPDELKLKYNKEIKSFEKGGKKSMGMKGVVSGISEDAYEKGEIKGEIAMLERLYNEAVIDEKQYQERLMPLKKKLEELASK